MFKFVVFFLLFGAFAAFCGYGIDGYEASVIFGLYFGVFPIAAVPIMAAVDNLQCRYNRWRRRNRATLWVI